ncbi:hypothetical protein BDW66DRAFT_135317 [Aspergillus desertorum]
MPISNPRRDIELILRRTDGLIDRLRVSSAFPPIWVAFTKLRSLLCHHLSIFLVLATQMDCTRIILWLKKSRRIWSYGLLLIRTCEDF